MPLDHARSKIGAAIILYCRGAGGSAGVPPATDETSHHLPPPAAPHFGCGGRSRTGAGWLMRPPWRTAPPRSHLAVAAGLEPAHLLLNRQVPYPLGYATKRSS